MSAGRTRELAELGQGRRPGLGSVAVAAGSLRRQDHSDLDFSFRYGGVLFAGRASSGVDSGHLRLHANLGALPYSCQSPKRRAEALAIVRSATKALGGRLQLTPQQRILLKEDRHFAEPLTPRLLVANTVRLVLEAKPFLELLAAVVPPPAER